MSQFNVLITHDQNMRLLKKQWFGVDEITDVISFASGAMMNKQIDKSTNRQTDDVVGEIVVNEDEVRRNAEAFGVSFEQEMARVVAHGVLHVYGYQDDTKEGKAAMKAIEDVVVSNGKWKLEVG